MIARTFAAWCRLLKSIGIGPEPITEVCNGRLFLGSITAASNLDLLLEHGITHVVTVTQFGRGACFFPYSMQYHVIEIADLPTEDIYLYLHPAVNFIKNALLMPGTSVFVHCIEGRSRSATIVLAYLMVINNWSVDEALKFLRDKRPIVDPNWGFIEDLRLIHL